MNIQLYPIRAAEDLLFPYKEKISQLQQYTGIDDKEWEKYYEPLFNNFAEMVQECPLAEDSSHSHGEDMLAYALESVSVELEKTNNMYIDGKKVNLTTYMIVTLTLLRNLGKLLTNKIIQLFDDKQFGLGLWCPVLGPMQSVARAHYYSFTPHNGEKHNVQDFSGALMAWHVIPPAGLSLLYRSRVEYISWLAMLGVKNTANISRLDRSYVSTLFSQNEAMHISKKDGVRDLMDEVALPSYIADEKMRVINIDDDKSGSGKKQFILAIAFVVMSGLLLTTVGNFQSDSLQKAIVYFEQLGSNIKVKWHTLLDHEQQSEVETQLAQDNKDVSSAFNPTTAEQDSMQNLIVLVEKQNSKIDALFEDIQAVQQRQAERIEQEVQRAQTTEEKVNAANQKVEKIKQQMQEMKQIQIVKDTEKKGKENHAKQLLQVEESRKKGAEKYIPPFKLLSVEVWDNEPIAIVSIADKFKPVAKGEHIARWKIVSVNIQNQSIEVAPHAAPAKIMTLEIES